jgi:aspartyl-tRNA(Asn)/glutamyl-tRNA(Gln) amidotransferase subunit A
MRTTIEIADAIRARRISAREALATAREAVAALNGRLNAFVYLDWDNADQVAADIDARVARGDELGPLAGVPFGVKELEDSIGMPNTNGSLLFRDAKPATKEAPNITRLKRAGAIAIGKTAASEFGADQANRTKVFGVTRNPWDLTRTPGGSSGGSAAAVAAGMVPFATGGDAGGSLRDPAAFTNLVSLKPSHGRIARGFGTNDLLVLGVLTTSVADHARLLDVLAGPEPVDKMSLPAPDARYEEVIETLEVRGLRAVWSGDLGGHAPADSEVIEIARAAALRLVRAADLELVDEVFELPVNPSRIFRRLSAYSSYAAMRMFGVWPDRLGELFGRTRMGAEAGARMRIEDLQDAQIDRGRVEAAVGAFFTRNDVLLTPTAACEAFAAEGPVPSDIAGKNASPGGAEPFANLANITWNPAISVPAGFTKAGLPVGLMITPRIHRDDVALRLARILEIAAPWPRLAPMAGDVRTPVLGSSPVVKVS